MIKPGHAHRLAYGYTVAGVDHGQPRRDCRKQVLRRVWCAPPSRHAILPLMRETRRAARHAGQPLWARTAGSSASAAIPRSTCQLCWNESARIEVSALRIHSSPNWEAWMEMDNGHDRKRQHRSYMSAVRKQVLADHRYTGLRARRIDSPRAFNLCP